MDGPRVPRAKSLAFSNGTSCRERGYALPAGNPLAGISHPAVFARPATDEPGKPGILQ